MPYAGDVVPGGPSAVRELDEAVARKASVGSTDNNVYLLTCRAIGSQLLVNTADDPHRLLDRLVGLANDLGLLAEEYDVEGRRMMGNVPQALSHLALVRAVYSHDEAVRRRSQGGDAAERAKDTRAVHR